MKLKIKNIFLVGIIISSLSAVGCVSSTMLSMDKHTNIEKIALTVLTKEELVAIKEVKLDDSNNSKKDLIITLNLSHCAKSVALENALLKATHTMNALEEVFKDSLNDYTFIVNTDNIDIYGNKQKIKILELYIKNEEIDKINFENFNYKNLEKIATIKKFNYLEDNSKVTNSFIDNDKLKKDIEIALKEELQLV